MKMSEFARETLKKGYTMAELAGMLTERGFRCGEKTLRDAANETNRTAKQEKLYKAGVEILASLPVKPGTEDNFSRKARERDLTVFSVWEYYNTTRPKKYALAVFSKAVAMPSFPFEREILTEALKCLDEMTDSNRV